MRKAYNNAMVGEAVWPYVIEDLRANSVFIWSCFTNSCCCRCFL